MKFLVILVVGILAAVTLFREFGPPPDEAQDQILAGIVLVP